tara:strand:+ start:1545 stop:2411 length:867 start_codon:yes stop_codon:yes gene_type:complete
MDAEKFYSPQELERQYNVRDSRADYETKIVPDWIKRSAITRTNLKSAIDISYGKSEKQKLDFFSSADINSPTVIFFHGGYWQRGDKSVYSFLANSFVNNNINFLAVGYDLCPKISITQIVSQAQEAIVWIWQNANKLEINKDKFIVSGHSAGGHITGMMMGTEWNKISSDLPNNLILAGIPISALNLLEPIRHTTLNDALKMDKEEAKSQSPIYLPPRTNAQQLIVYGANETDEFHRQSNIYYEKFKSKERKIERFIVQDADHFDEMNDLSNESSEFFKKMKKFIELL